MAKRSNGEGTLFQRKDGLWCGSCYVSINGVSRRKYVYGKMQKEVKEKLKALQYNNENGLVLESSSMLFQDWMQIWLENYKCKLVKATSYYGYQNVFETHILDSYIGRIPLKKLTTTILQGFYNEKLTNGRRDGKGALSPTTVKRIHILIKSCLEQAVKNEMLSKNVSKAVILPPKSKMEFTPFTVDEVHKLLESAKKDSHIFPLLILEVYTGLRKGELLGLQWQDIDFENKKLFVRHNLCRIPKVDENGKRYSVLELMEPKTAKSKRILPLNDCAISVLKEHKKQQNLWILKNRDIYQDKNIIFSTRTGNFIHPRDVSKRFHRILEKAGLERKRFHDLRHTFASILLNEGESVKMIQELLGHSTITTTLDIYSHISEESKIKSIDKLTNKINKII